jgi:hypothetical protein
VTQQIERATQGHRYRVRAGLFDGTEVLCLAGGEMARVAPIDERKPWPLGSTFLVSANSLQPMPMRYFNGEVPR